MLKHFEIHPWRIIESGFDTGRSLIAESCFSIGNGWMGQRASFEENYSGPSTPGSYIAGLFHTKRLDKPSHVGEPELAASIANAPNWIGIEVQVAAEILDLATAKIKDFQRILNMKEGTLERSFTAKLLSGKEVRIKTVRFCSMQRKEVAAISYSIKPLNFDGPIRLMPFIDGEVHNIKDNFGEEPWKGINQVIKKRSGYVLAESGSTGSQICVGMKLRLLKNGESVEFATVPKMDEKYVACAISIDAKKEEEYCLHKFVGVVSSLHHKKSELFEQCQATTRLAFKKGFKKLRKEQSKAWAKIWSETDIEIEGDLAAQQGIRFNIFHLLQSYAGNVASLNIGPKGLTSEKHGGLTYWDTEAFCFPFFLSVAESGVARNLLIYRYKQLGKAIKNATKVGLENGAALYPLATMNGEECINETGNSLWEIHRNGAIAFAIFNYVNYTGDKNALSDFGMEMLVGIARFWKQRMHFSITKKQYVIIGVTGPNNYEANVNNNWYTNYLAAWCFKYAVKAVNAVKEKEPALFFTLKEKLNLDEEEELNDWKNIADNIYLPQNNKLGIAVQHDGFLDKEMVSINDIDPSQLPLKKQWSWDKILRSSFIKQADVLLGMYFFQSDFKEEYVRRNFEFYETKTVHESSLSPCIHAILAARLGLHEKAYDLYLRTARLDLDNYNNDTEEGLHVTSMAGTWLALVQGFGGMRVEKNMLSFRPYLPNDWKSYSFKIKWRGHLLQLKMDKKGPVILNLSNKEVKVKLNGVVNKLPI